MIRIGVFTESGAGRLLERLLPAASRGVWAERHFSAFEPGESYDWVVIFFRHGLMRPLEVHGDPANVAYVSTEPYEIANTRPTYLHQFSRVILTDPRVRHPGLVRETAAPWWVGLSVDRESVPRHPARTMYGYDQLSRAPVPKKVQRVSIVTSTASFTPGHRARSRLVESMLRHPIARHVDLFGTGRRQVLDKWDAIAPNAYHLALESSSLPNYWTEKVSDAFLAYSLPLYHGCPNLEQYFPPESFVDINAFDPALAITAIERVLDEHAWQERLPHIVEARNRVLGEHHPLSVIARTCDRPASEHTRFTIEPRGAHGRGLLGREWWKAKRRLYSRTVDVEIRGRPMWRFPP
jgi:hypothetical protein